jgi:hypothetical protein
MIAKLRAHFYSFLNVAFVLYLHYASFSLQDDTNQVSLTSSNPRYTMSPSPPNQPSLPWRATSSLVMGVTGFLSRSFLFGFSNTEVIGLDRFLEVLDGRKDVGNRDRGLLTGKLPRSSLKDEPCADRYGVIVSNHISVCVRVLENIEDFNASLGEELKLIEIRYQSR